jgi:DNA-binding NtrC family response regulator
MTDTFICASNVSSKLNLREATAGEFIMGLNDEIDNTGAKFTVLLIDDNNDVLNTLETILEGAGHRVIAKPDALSALAVIDTNAQIDVIVTDYFLPHMNGLEFLGKVRSSLPHVPVIVLTGYESTDTYSKCVDQGVYKYLHKPILPRELRQFVQAAISDAKRVHSEATAA